MLTFLALIMLTPSLACAMAYCPMQGPENTEESVSPNCHEADSEVTAPGLPMLSLDCMGVDLFEDQQAWSQVPQPSDDLTSLPLFSMAFLDGHDVTLAEISLARGPPPLSKRVFEPHQEQPVYHITQRFRI